MKNITLSKFYFSIDSLFYNMAINKLINSLNDQISIPRKVIIIQILFMLGIIERFGVGIRRIKKAY